MVVEKNLRITERFFDNRYTAQFDCPFWSTEKTIKDFLDLPMVICGISIPMVGIEVNH